MISLIWGGLQGKGVVIESLEGNLVTGNRFQKLLIIICSKCKTGNKFCTCIPTYSRHVTQFFFFFPIEKKNGSSLRTDFKYKAICENCKSKEEIIRFLTDYESSPGPWLYVNAVLAMEGPPFWDTSHSYANIPHIHESGANRRAATKTRI